METQELESLLKSMPFAGIVLDSRAAILTADARAERWLGKTLAELRGKSFFSLLPDPDAKFEEGFLEGVARNALSFFLVSPAPPDSSDEGPMKIHVGVVPGVEPLGLVLLEPLRGEQGLQRRIQALEERIYTVSKIRHEINNLLMGLMGHTELLQNYPLAEEAKRKIDLILTQERRVKEQVELLGRVTRPARG